MAPTKLNYEACVILNSALDETEREALIEKLRNIIVAGGADLKETALWGKRRLAYPIEKRTDGYYVVFYFQSVDAREILEQLERTCRFDENVMRYMSLKVPTRKRGQEVAQLVPTPGWLAGFKLEARASGPRRRPEGARGDRGDAPRRDEQPVEAPKAETAESAPEAAPATDEA